jgi:DNA-binding response OmpR family regulator
MKKVLIAEDEAVLCGMLRTILQRQGYDVRAVHGGEDAVRVADVFEPDMLVMDIYLDDMLNGIEAARRIRTSRQVPVIYITGIADSALLREAAGTEQSMVLHKPFGRKEFLSNIDCMLAV